MITPLIGVRVPALDETTSVAMAGGDYIIVYTGGKIQRLSVTQAQTLLATPVGDQSANVVYAGPNGTTGAAAFRALVAADIPSLPASKITSGQFGSANGGTGNAFTKFSGPTTAEKTFSLPNASCNVLTDNAAVTVAQGGTGAATLTTHGLLVGAGTGAVSGLTAGTDGQLPIGQTGANPAFTTVSGDVTITNGGVTAIGAGKVTNAMLSGSIDLTAKVTGALPLSNGGTAAALSDPGAHRLYGWDHTDSATKFVTLGANLTYDHSTHTLSASGSGGSSSIGSAGVLQAADGAGGFQATFIQDVGTGDFVFGGGDGSSATLELNTSTGTGRIFLLKAADDANIMRLDLYAKQFGIFGKADTPASQQTANAAITDSSGGSNQSTLYSPSFAAFSDVESYVANLAATVAAQANAINTLLTAYGLGA